MGYAASSASSVSSRGNWKTVDVYRDLIRPTPKQVDFLIAAHTKKFVLYGGAVGGGKSYILRWFLVDYLIRMRKSGLKNVEVGLFCETFPDLQDRHIDKAKAEFPEWLGRWRKFDFILHEDAGIIKFRNLDDPRKYLSAEFAAEAVDELTRNPKSTFDDLRLRLRWPGISHLPFVAGTNPGGVGHQFVLSTWINGILPDDLAEEYGPEDFGFIQALPRDNPHLTPEYFRSLNSLPDMMKKAYLEGDWTVFAGMFFPMFKRRIHVEKPFPVPREWALTASLDPGWASPCCFSVYATDFDGVIHNVATYYQANRSTPQHAHGIFKFLREDIKEWTGGRLPYLITAGHDAWARKDRHAVIANEATVADIFQDSVGLNLTKAVVDRIPGWWRVRDALEHERIKFFGNGLNERVLQQLESVLTDESVPEDIQGRGNDAKVEDHCLAPGTLVHTTSGMVPIKHLAGSCGYVYSFLGRIEFFNMCRKTRKKAEMVTVFFDDGTETTCTPDHLFWTMSGWVRAADLLGELSYISPTPYNMPSQGDQTCLTCARGLRSCPLPFKSFLDCGITFAENISREVGWADCTGRCGSIISGNYPQAGISTYTMQMETDTITRSKTWKNIQALNMFARISRTETTEVLARFLPLPRLLLLLQNGTAQKWDVSGTVNMQKRLSQKSNHKSSRRYACDVVWNMSVAMLLGIEANIAAPTVRFVRCMSVKTVGKSDVYCLNVPGAEAFAINNGVIVHNCLDALRYMLMTIYRPSEKPEDTSWQRPEDFIGKRSKKYGRPRVRRSVHRYGVRPWAAS